MTECEFIEKCPIFQKCQTGMIEGVFGVRYCKGSQLENCERRKLKKDGKEVPLNLLPNGKHLTTV